MDKIYIYLDDAKHPRAFRQTGNILDQIAREFQKVHPPQILFDITEDENNPAQIATETNPLVPGRFYRWKTAEEKWQNKELVQNALFCSLASYEDRPLSYLMDKRRFHSVTLLIAANLYFGKQVASLFISTSEGFGKQKKTLIIAFRGTKTFEDVVSDFKIGFKTDSTFVGKIHGGFLQRMQSVSTEKIFQLAKINEVDEIVTCGSCLGGAVSSLVHLKLLYDLENNASGDDPVIDAENLVNVTFAAPMIGNYELAKHVNEKQYARNMFHFSFVGDIVPVVLSVGHVFEVLKQNVSFGVVGAKTAIFSQIRKIIPLFKFCLAVAANVLENPVAKNIQGALKSLNAPPSSLYNAYTELNYVPIGKYLLIQKLDQGVSIEHLKNNPKIVERVLQSATDLVVKDYLGSLSKIREFHSLDNYRDLIKTYFGGFALFGKAQICIEKKDCKMFQDENDHIYNFESVCSFTCGAFCTNSQPLNQKVQDIVFCKTCYEDQGTIEHFFHVTCSKDFHLNEKENHVTRKFDWENFTDNPDEWKQIFLDPDLERYKIPFWKVGQAIASNAAVPARQIFQIRSHPALISGLLNMTLSSAKTNAIGTAVMFGVSLSFDIAHFFRGKITAKQLVVATFESFASSVASGGASIGASSVSALVGSLFGPVGTMLGYFAGGLIGGIVGYWAGKMGAKKIADKMGWCKLPEDEQKADVIVDALVLLEVPLPNGNVEEIIEEDVMKCFRRKALRYHPDKLTADASEREKSECKLSWCLISFSRNTLVAYSKDPQSLSGKVVKLVNRNWRRKKDQVDMLRMKEKIEALGKKQKPELAVEKPKFCQTFTQKTD
ncbi:uncharacterized protein LOC134839263 isoform X1 [Symsagittifera roscoffensis]|uniref:uncharacterized protein LOC134839263 isoform X1 n=1 Tax=Symsagittifera roscoffensis TaxID=84072 RepID=UPI00307BAAEB